MERYWLVIKDGYRVTWDGITNWVYPFPHDLVIEDINNNVGIGDWYWVFSSIHSYWIRPYCRRQNDDDKKRFSNWSYFFKR